MTLNQLAARWAFTVIYSQGPKMTRFARRHRGLNSYATRLACRSLLLGPRVPPTGKGPSPVWKRALQEWTRHSYVFLIPISAATQAGRSAPPPDSIPHAVSIPQAQDPLAAPTAPLEPGATRDCRRVRPSSYGQRRYRQPSSTLNCNTPLRAAPDGGRSVVVDN